MQGDETVLIIPDNLIELDYLVCYNQTMQFTMQGKQSDYNRLWGDGILDKNMEYISDTQTLIGNKKRELLDIATGELIHVDQITKRSYGTKQFWKVYLMDFLMVLGIIDNRQLDVFIYIAEHTEQSQNLFIGTYSKIASETGASRDTIAKIMKKLQANNFITKVQNGVWRVNPNILMKGNDTKRQILLSYYQEEKIENESLELTRGKRDEIPVLLAQQEQAATLLLEDNIECKMEKNKL